MPLSAPLLPPGSTEIISSPGANKSGLNTPSLISPSPENTDIVSVLELKLPTVITLCALPGIVTVNSVVGLENLVSLLNPSDVGRYIFIPPFTIFLG